MFHRILRATIATLVFLPVFAQAGPIIVYQSVEARSSVGATVTNRDTGESDSDSIGTPVIPNPQDAVVNAALGSTSSTVGLDFELDQANNLFSIDASIAAIGNDVDNSFARAVLTIGMFIDFTVESDTDDLVELMFSFDGSRQGLDGLAADTRLFVDVALFGPAGGAGFSLFDDAAVSGTESLLVQPGESYRLLTLVDIENRLPLSDPTNQHLDAVGTLQLTSSLAVRSVPEPWSLAMLGFGLLAIGWRRAQR